MSLERSTPHGEGVDADGLADFVEAAHHRELELHSLMVARHGRVVAEHWWPPYRPDRIGLVYSLSKSFTATAVGFCVQERLLGLDDRVLDLLPDVDRTAIHPHWGDVTVRHCLSMTVGHRDDAWPAVPDDARSGGDAPGTDWLPQVLATDPVEPPGSVFAYNQVATYLLSIVVGRAGGTGLIDVLRPRLLEPLGIDRIAWQRDPLGRELGFSGAHVSTEAVLSLAQFYLDRGRWDGRRLLAESWFDVAAVFDGPPNTDPGAGPDWRRGYGFSFWGQRFGFRGDGAFGQYAIVLPDQDMTIAITSEVEDMQTVLDLLWEHVLPAVDRTSSALADARLTGLLATAAGSGPPVPSGATDPVPTTFTRWAPANGTPAADIGATPHLPARYHAVTIAPDGDESLLVLHRGDERLEIRVGNGVRVESDLVAAGMRLPVQAAGGWHESGRYRAEVVLVETPHRFAVTADRATGVVELRWRMTPPTSGDPFESAVHPAPASD